MLFLVSCTRETVQLPSFPTFVRVNGVTLFKFLFQTIPDKRVGTRSKFSPPPLSMLIIKWIFPFLMEKTWYYPTLIKGGWGMRDTARVPTTFRRDCRLWFTHWPHLSTLWPTVMYFDVFTCCESWGGSPNCFQPVYTSHTVREEWINCLFLLFYVVNRSKESVKWS